MTRIGCIGQGWIGKNYADDFEARGHTVIRYALEEPYVANKDVIATCDVVFVAVPTPTTQKGFDASIVRAVLPLVGAGKIVVLKSTLIPGTTDLLQKEFPTLTILHAPEFLREAHAAHDVAHPARNIIGIPADTQVYTDAAQVVLSLIPPAPYTAVMSARSAELLKYAGNIFLAMKVVFANMLYDLAAQQGVAYEEIRDALAADPRIGASHLSPVLASGHTKVPGRGAGGHCFIKDLEAFRQLYRHVSDVEGSAFLTSLVEKNNRLLRDSEKDIDLLQGVYGKNYDVLP